MVSLVVLPFRMFRILETSSWLAVVWFCVAPQTVDSKPAESLSRLSEVSFSSFFHATGVTFRTSSPQDTSAACHAPMTWPNTRAELVDKPGRVPPSSK